ncbi:hypothetical protein OQA88_7644 [Cercophora sp. LCS_1]
MPGGQSARKRARTFEVNAENAADDEGHSKGGHSLRKRARIDYTQEQIDDQHLPFAARSEVTKSAVTPSARSRKKKQIQDGITEEDEDFNSATGTQKRRRPEKSPAPTRGGPSRRRTQPKKSTAGASTYHVDQASDNEVKDTIMVGVSMDDDLEFEDEESVDSESFADSETRPSTSDGSDAALAQAEPEPATPQPESIPQVEQAVSLAPEAEEVIEGVPVSDQTDEKNDVAPTAISLPIQPKLPDEPNVNKAEQAARDSTPADEAKLESPEQPESDNQPVVPPQPDKSEVEVNAEPEVEPKLEPGEPENVAVKLEAEPTIQTQEASTGPEEPVKSSEPLPIFPTVHDTVEPTRRASVASTSSRRTRPRPTEPIRMKELERVYQIPTPFASEMNLTPYEAESVVHPGPFTERVNPEERDRPEVTPMPTPAHTPSPVDPVSIETKWDCSRPLKQKEFFVLFRQESKRRQEQGEPPISMAEFNNECVRKFKAARQQLDFKATNPSNLARAIGKAVWKRPTVTMGSFEDTPQGSQVADSELPTAAPSPAAIEDEDPPADPDADGDEDQEASEPKAQSKTSSFPVEVTRLPSRQYLFPKIRDPQELVDALENFQEMDTTEAYIRTAAGVEYMDSLQKEYHELRKILDDEENAKRRLANDKTIVNWENRQKNDEPAPWRRHYEDAVKGPPVFEVRGARAPKPYIDDPVLERQREEDKIFAQAYGFKHNPHPTQVGRQNPEEQRWENAENRLRERKKTEKGAELAEENVLEGKRMRKPRTFGDQSSLPSRSGTPIGMVAQGLGRGGRRRRFVDDEAELDNASFEPEPPRRRRGGFRGRGQIAAEEEPAPSTQVEEHETDEETEKPSARKRGPPKRHVVEEEPEPSTQPDDNQTDDDVEDKPLTRKRAPRKRQSTIISPVRQKAKPEIASSSFYSTQSADSQQESRPSTASSVATVNTEETGESAYSLRDKRKRNFALENDPELEPRATKRTRSTALPKPEGSESKKRTPRRKAVTSQPAEPPAAEPEPAPPVPPPAVVPAPAPVGGLKAPILFYSNPPPALAPAPAPYLHTFSAAPAFAPGGPPPPPAAPPSIKKPITKIKLTNFGGASSSRATTPANIAPNPNGKGKGARAKEPKPAPINTGNLDEKPYAEMSKSEKMSWSMRRRWARGEMQGAVEKRRSTLAKKKEIKENGNGDSTVNSDVGDASASGTPTPVPTIAGMAQPPPQGVAIAPLPTPAPAPSLSMGGGLQMPGLQGLQMQPGMGGMGYYPGV